MKAKSLIAGTMLGLFLNLFYVASASAGSKLTKVDLDIDTTEIVEADTDILGWFYYIDKTACICWVGGKSTFTAGPVIIDCGKLKAYAPLREHLAKCVGGVAEKVDPPANRDGTKK